MMLEFLSTPAGRAVSGVFIAVVVLALLDLNYRFFAKALLDFLFALTVVIMLSPLLVTLAVISRVNAGKTFETVPYLGVKCKIIYLHSFAGINGRLKYFAEIFDVLGGKMSFIGVKPLEIADGALMDDKYMERFTARPGIICHMLAGGYDGASYEDMFALDARYAKRRELFTDIFIFIKWLVLLARGEDKSYLGEAEAASYTKTLLERGAITQSGFEQAQKFAADTISKNEGR